MFSLYYNWKLPVWNLMVCMKLFSYRRKSFHYIWTTESKNFVLFWKEISLNYNWKLPALKLTVCTKLFSLRQIFSHYIWAVEDKNCYVSVTYPQYYWKVSIALRGCLEKFLTVRLLQLETFTVKLRIFGKRKMPLTYIENLMVGFTRFSR